MKNILSFLVLAMTITIITGCKKVNTTTTTITDTTAAQTTETTVTTQEEIKYYTNPVFEPVLADPAIIRDDDGYFYVFGTTDYGQWGETYGTKYVPILKSRDLFQWEFAGSVFTMQTRPIWGTPNAGIWAPDITKIGDQYVLYYALSTWGDPNPGIGVATAPHPLGPWTDHGKLFDSNSIGVNNSIDPAVFKDENGRVYIIWGSFRGLYGVELTSDGLALKDGDNAKNTKVRVAGYDTSAGWNGGTYEGAYIIHKDNYYYLFASSGTCCDGHSSSYNVKVARSESPLGPYYDDMGNNMLGAGMGYQVLAGNSFFAGPGHNSIIKDDAGNYWILYHAYKMSEPESLGSTPRRSLMLDKLVWSDGGWPSVKFTMPSNTAQEIPIFNK